MLKDGSALPPPDTLMRQLIDIANSENPPCSNCDKRDRANMYYCNTCGQALCSHCRDNTHRAKMFASHEVVHMSKCSKEPKRCTQHGEHYIMYSPLQNAMLCVNCFRDLPNEVRGQCLDIDTAHAQAAKRLERGQNAIMDLQTSVRDGIIALKGLMDELRRNMDSEKHTINTFCQGMQEAMAKTHATMIMEVQRQFESKERIYRSQLLVLGTVMPVLQLHLVLCTTFTAAANKYQFLELCPSLIERLSAVGNLSQPVRSLQSSQIKTNYRSEFAQCLEPWIGPAAVSQHQSELATASRMYDTAPIPTKKQQNALKNKLLEGESSFSAHCRSFESQIRELNQQFNMVKEKVGELHKDISALRKAQTPPLSTRYDMLTRECLHLDQSLERQQQELDRMATVFDASWEEQLWRLRVEQEVFSCQRADVNTLRNELKHLSQVASQLEPYIRTLTPAQQSQSSQSDQGQSQNEQAQHLASLLEHMSNRGILPQSEASLGKIPRSRSRVLGQLLEKVRPNLQERERSKSAGQSDKPLSTPQKPAPKKPFMSSQQMNIDRLEAHIKEKLHDIMNRRPSQPSSKSDTETDRKLMKDDRKLSKTDLDSIAKLGSKQRIMYKKIGKSCDKINTTSKSDSEVKKCKSESEYQRISDATSQNIKALVHETRSSPSSPKGKNKDKLPTKQPKKKVYPYSDGEDNVFYSMNDSADSLSTSSRRSSFEGPDKTLVVVINRRNKNMSMAQKQRSWETFPPKRRHHMCQPKLSVPTPMPPLRKADSFEDNTMGTTKLLLPDYISQNLKCDLCQGYLSVPPISTYEDKFSCGRCNPGWPRNVIYEQLAQFVFFPCTYCEEKLSWNDIPQHEQRCRHKIILCPAGYEKSYKLSKMPSSNLGQYHKECQIRTISCPFDYCDTKYEVKDVLPHFQKFHKDYVFMSNVVSARKILKEEKVWNFKSDNQVCLLVFKQMPFLLFVHSDSKYDETTGDIISYEYYFGVFSFCVEQCDIKYTASIALVSDSDNSSYTMKNQDVKPFNQRLHSIKFLRIGLVKHKSFNFMTTKFESLKRTPDLKLTYTIKLLDNFEPLSEKPKEKPTLKVDSFSKNFECPICKEYMHPPVFNCELGHSVCKNCKLKMLICPFCKAFIGNSRNFVFEDILETLQIACSNEYKGCTFSGKVQEVKFHELKCLYNI